MTTGTATSRRSRTANLTTAALVTALISASAWISIPLGTVPVTLQVFFVVLAALLLPPVWAAASMGLYVALGAVGLPVFSGAKGGFGVLAGPTGGYLFGFVIGAFAGALVLSLLPKSLPQVVRDLAAAAAVIVTAYALGTLQLGIVLGLSADKAIAAGALPFIAADAIKAVVAVGAATAIRKAIRS